MSIYSGIEVKVVKYATLLIVLVVLSPHAYPWGQTGHRIVGRIAENHLSKEAARVVETLIGPKSLAQVSTWADEIRSNPTWKHAAPWHSVSIDDGETYDTSTKNPSGDVIEAMKRFETVLRGPQANRKDKVLALKFLVHLVGDAHQPLHAARRVDRGGRTLQVSWFGEPTNLHWVWDEHMIDATKLSFSEFAQFIDHPSIQEIAAWQNGTYIDWLQESMNERKTVYDIGNANLSYVYWDKNLPIVKQRLLQAGVRLAGLLDSIFSER